MDAAYVASAISKGGRMGHVRSESGFVDQDVAIPTELGGPGGATNPEELLAAGWATCFMSALGLLCAKREIDTSEATVTANVGVDLGKAASTSSPRWSCACRAWSARWPRSSSRAHTRSARSRVRSRACP